MLIQIILNNLLWHILSTWYYDSLLNIKISLEYLWWFLAKNLTNFDQPLTKHHKRTVTRLFISSISINIKDISIKNSLLQNTGFVEVSYFRGIHDSWNFSEKTSNACMIPDWFFSGSSSISWSHLARTLANLETSGAVSP